MKTKLSLIMAFLSFSLLNAQAVGDVITGGIVNFKITAIGTTNEVEVSNDLDIGGTVEIPAQVEDGGVTYDVTAIGQSAFLKNTNITELILPSSVTHVKESGFQECTALASANLEHLVQIDKRGFRQCVALVPTNTTFASLTTTGPSPFDRCNAFTTINIPVLTNVDNFLFTQCEGLTSVTLSPSLTSISTGMFDRTIALTSVTIPSGVTSVEANAFRGCTALTTINSLNTTPPTVSASAFTNVDLSVIALIVPSASQSLYDNASIWEDFPDPSSLSVDNIEQDLDYNIYTNSANDILTIKSENIDNAIVTIYDISGKAVLTYNITRQSSEVSISSLTAGVYIIRIKTETAEFAKKFVKE